MPVGITELAILLSIATILGVVLRIFKQPVILAYLATGAIVGLYGTVDVNSETYKIFSDLGIMFLLFLVGLEINYTSLRQVGRTSLVVGIGQIIFTFGIGYLIAIVFGFESLTSAYIAIALTFSSTIIIIKLLSEKKDINSLYGKISIGFMLVQDFIAILLLVFLAGIETGGDIMIGDLIVTLIKGIVLFVVMLWLGRTIMPYLLDRVARSQELLFLSSTAWVLVVAVLVTKFGFSIEIGGFLAGIALANSSENYQIASKIKPLRDFFILLFFIILGASLVSYSFAGLALPIIVFSLFVLIGNPLIVLIIMSIMGYRKRTSFMAGVTVAQISEFSLILVALGLKVGHIEKEIVGLITAVGVVTITLSTYMIIYGDDLARKLTPVLSWFERRSNTEDDIIQEEFNKPVILIGSHRIGESIVHHLSKEDLLIIDFDPDIIKKFKENGHTTLLGDIADEEIEDIANLDKAKIIISTADDFEDNMRLLKKMQTFKGRRKIILRAETNKEAEILYNNGAHYVIFPHLTAGHYLGKLISNDLSVSFLTDLKKHDLAVIKQRV